jgi:tRNA(fMet)-specific endonuclease VapC
MRGCWNAVNKVRDDVQLVSAYDLCHRIVDYYSRRNLLDFDMAAAQRFRQLRQTGIRIGTQDLRLAAIALERGAVVVSRNRNDFNQVPGLKVEDWSV